MQAAFWRRLSLGIGRRGPRLVSAAGATAGQAIADDEERDLEVRAKAYHRKAALGFLVHDCFIAGSFISLPYLASVFQFLGQWLDFNSGRLAYVLTFVMLAWLVRNWTIYNQNKQDWPVHEAHAQVTTQTDVALDGFIGLFRTYVGSRKDGMYSYIWAIWGILAAFFVAFSYRKTLLADIWLLVALGLLVIASLLNILVGFRMSKRFRVGRVLVDHIRILNYRASTSQTSVSEANRETAAIAADFKRRMYWWFY